jgi:hypothetical protein
MGLRTIEICAKGKYFKVPALNVDGKDLTISGRWLRKATIHEEAWSTSDVESPEAIIAELRKHAKAGFRADIFTFVQTVPLTQPQFPYYWEGESVAAASAVDIQKWWSGLPQETRKNVRRSQKRGVEVRVAPLDDALVRQIISVNNETPTKQGKVFTHFGKDFDEVKKDQSSFPDRSDYVCAFLEDELIGFMKLVHRGNTASILTLLCKPSHADKRPANAIIAKAMELCHDKGFSHLTYGLLNYGNKKESDLKQFKVRNGFEEILVPRYFIPLTWKGSLVLKLGLHRGMIGLLPSRLIRVLLSIRSVYYRFSKPV